MHKYTSIEIHDVSKRWKRQVPAPRELSKLLSICISWDEVVSEQDLKEGEASSLFSRARNPPWVPSALAAYRIKGGGELRGREMTKGGWKCHVREVATNGPMLKCFFPPLPFDAGSVLVSFLIFPSSLLFPELPYFRTNSTPFEPHPQSNRCYNILKTGSTPF